MTQDTFRTTLDSLRSERESAERDVVELSAKLDNVNHRLGHLRRAIESIEALLGVPSVDDEAVLADDSESTGASVRELDFSNTADGPTETPAEEDPDFGPIRKRVPSTEWVAEVVKAIGRPADRDEVFEAFGHIKGFPPSWTNPRNSVNNALGRAVERELIIKIDQDRFAPIDYNPFEDHFPERGSRDG